MLLTLLLSIMMMVGLFVLLLSGVALIQDKRFFTSAPKEVYEAVQPRNERFRGARALGYVIVILAFLCMGAAIVIGAVSGIKNSFTFLQFFVRFLVMLLLLKAFDILFFDWVLLCNSNFFPYFYPEVKNLVGPHLFGYNKKSHSIQTVALLIGSAALAGICTVL